MSCRRRSSLFGNCDIPRQEIGEAAENMAHVGLWIASVELCEFHDGVNSRSTLAAGIRASEHPVTSSTRPHYWRSPVGRRRRSASALSSVSRCSRSPLPNHPCRTRKRLHGISLHVTRFDSPFSRRHWSRCPRTTRHCFNRTPAQVSRCGTLECVAPACLGVAETRRDTLPFFFMAGCPLCFNLLYLADRDMLKCKGVD